MPVHPSARTVRALLPVVAAALLGACSGPGAADPAAPAPPPAADPASDPAPDVGADGGPTEADEPYEVVLVADLGPLPDGSGEAVVETVWTVDAVGTRRLVVDTPAGHAAHHVMTDDEHWWWLDPGVRERVADAEWVHFDLREIDAVGGELPELVAEARVPVPAPGDIHVGQTVAGHVVLAAEVVSGDEVHLTVAGIEQPVVHRRRILPAGTVIERPEGAVDVADLPDVLRW